MRRQGKVEKMTYFDEQLHWDLLKYLSPYYRKKKGNDELLRLAQIGLLALRGVGPRLAPDSAPANIPTARQPEEALREAGSSQPSSPRRHNGTNSEGDLERARRAAQSDFKFRG